MNNPPGQSKIRQILAQIFILFLVAVQIQSCTGSAPTAAQPPSPTAAPVLTVQPPSTITPSPALRRSATADPTLAARRATSTAFGLWTAEELTARAPTLTFTPTAVPEGIYTLLFYPPLVMDYPPSLWIDNSDYPNSDYLSNYLTSKSLASCVLGWRGGSGVPEVSEPVHTRILGKLKFQVLVFYNTAEKSKNAWYLEQSSVTGFDYSQANPILVISASDLEWQTCVELGEQVFATLRVP